MRSARDVRDYIEGDNAISVVGVEVDEVAGARARKFIEDLVLQIAVRIDDADAAPSMDVLHDDVLQRARLAHAGLADHEHVVHAVEFGQCEFFNTCMP